MDEPGMMQSEWFQRKKDALSAARRLRQEFGGCWYVRKYDP